MGAKPHELSCLVLALCCLSVSADVFLSIDCGSSVSYRDDNLIDWSGDDNFTRTGESRSVPSASWLPRAAATLRVFTSRAKNCYHIDSFKRGRALVRAGFYYGNYDGRSSPPTFELQFDGNRWATVETLASELVYHEVVYVMKGESISVCLAQTRPGQFPFLSSLEFRSLEPFMYAMVNETQPLFLRRRVAFGSNATIRYPNDLYDRIWSPEESSEAMIPVSSTAVFNGPIILSELPPPAVLKHAVTAVSPTSSLQINMGFPIVEVPVYINAYFSEVSRLQLNETRSMSIFKDNQPFSQPFSPPYANCTQLYTNNITASTNTTFSIVPANDSTLPPLINAIEVFVVGPDLTNGTDRRDVQGLEALQNVFGTLADWSGDPCLPAPYAWDWIDCSSDSTPRVTALLLSSFGLSEMLPNFSSMDALRTIDFHNNSLQGPIPDFLGTLPNLRTLNLANNRLNGSIPASLSNRNGLDLVVTGNTELCASGELCPASSGNERLGSDVSTENINNLPTLIFGIVIYYLMVYLLE
ncbi:Probable LRR receptor-like serine/threonine-protein kinase [Striga hermonthica]|uniref:Probable LRR receptor-like serine/threonine-protein kinase n=1 Tax=Striga hermonthica TaxID=68872 RepID=A0A9N7N2Q6_STRHE|nr:Probable LRR receptor-like serine/threonine-protein kinase [Striga hermonthica]